MARSTRMAGIIGKLGFLDGLHFNPNIVHAAGSNSQANSTLLTAAFNIITTLSAVTTRGVQAFAATTGALLIIKNAQTTNLKVYPGVSSQLGTASVNAAVSIGALKTGIWIARSRIKWDLILSIA